ncbi:metal-sensitive transcriptional regulator [bacterium]|nr:metal-sensitive transcriptional regulator [bacterium]
MRKSDKSSEDVLNRFRRVEGQIRGIQRLLEQGASCGKVIVQIKAARTALDAAGKLVLACYLAECLKGDEAAEDEALEMLVKF